MIGNPAGTARPTNFECALFHCCLDDQPDDLVPKRLFRADTGENPIDRPLFVNPNCFFVRGGDTSDERTGGAQPEIHFPVEAVDAQCDVVWVRDPATRSALPFWLGSRLAALLAGTRAGDMPPPRLTPLDIEVLSAAHVLVPNDWARARQREWHEVLSVCGDQFRQTGYTPLGGLVHPFHLAALRGFYRHHIRSGNLPLGDAQQARRFVSCNDPVAGFFHHQLSNTVGEIVGEPVKPSYVYFSAYQEGASLKRHVDRAQCEFSISLSIDYSPEPEAATPWPLKLYSDGCEVTIFQALGDALIYRGRELPHWREELPMGHSSSSIFFHYVQKNFDGPLS